MRLCAPCEAIFQNPKFSRYSSFSYTKGAADKDLETHHINFGSFEEALHAKCPFCMRLLSLVKGERHKLYNKDGRVDPDLDLSTLSMEYRMARENAQGTAISFRSITHVKKRGSPLRAKVDQYMFLARKQQVLAIRHEPSIGNGPDTNAMKTIVSWISYCRDHHVICQQNQSIDQNRKFARILRIVDLQDTLTVQLCNTEEMPSDSPYMTLSHCWGGAKIAHLKKDNYDIHLKGVSVQELPQTFRDAIQLTQRIGVKYLWIDAMCIIQDSNKDWLEHASLMDMIYQGSFCNIAATASLDPYGGLFRERDPIMITPLRVLLCGALPGNIDAFYDVGDDFSNEWMHQVAMSPLCVRAWVVQERLLAPRVVHFAESQLFWECTQVRTNEAQTIGRINQSGWRHEKLDFKKWHPFSDTLLEPPSCQRLGLNYVWSSVKAMLDWDLTESRKTLLASDPEALAQAKRACYGTDLWTRTHPFLSYWANIVDNYSNSRLTRFEDRLIAIAGIAKILSARTGIRYVAGHWHYQLPRQLLWSSVDLKSADNDDQFIAPSWSWASRPLGLISNMILNPILEKKGAMDLIHIMNVDVQGTRKEESPTGQLASAKLRVRGRLLPIELDLSAWPEPFSSKDTLVQYWQPSVSDPPKRETFLVPVLFSRWNEKLPTATSNALLLESLEKKGTYRRIGTARLSSLCNLRYTTPHLSRAKSSHHEDSDDDANTGDEVDTTDPQTGHVTEAETPIQPRPLALNPREELHEKRMAIFSSKDSQQALNKFRNKLSAKSPQNLLTVLSRVNRVMQARPGRPPENQGKFVISEDVKQSIQQSVQQTFANSGMGTVEIRVEQRQNPGVPMQTPKLAPKEAVAPHFYLEYLDDEDSTRYGCFVFDIV